MQQKVLLLTTDPGLAAPRGLDSVNEHLARGWHVVQVAPLGGGGAGERLGAVFVLERRGPEAADALTLEESLDLEYDEALAEALAEPELDERLEGDGAASGEPPLPPGGEGGNREEAG